MLKKMAILKAFTTKRGLYNNFNSKILKIPRVPVTKNITKFKFWLKTRTIYENI